MIAGEETPEKPHRFYENKNRLIEKLVVEQLFEPVNFDAILAIWSRRITNWIWKWLEIFREPAPS